MPRGYQGYTYSSPPVYYYPCQPVVYYPPASTSPDYVVTSSTNPASTLREAAANLSNSNNRQTALNMITQYGTQIDLADLEKTRSFAVRSNDRDELVVTLNRMIASRRSSDSSPRKKSFGVGKDLELLKQGYNICNDDGTILFQPSSNGRIEVSIKESGSFHSYGYGTLDRDGYVSMEITPVTLDAPLEKALGSPPAMITNNGGPSHKEPLLPIPPKIVTHPDPRKQEFISLIDRGVTKEMVDRGISYRDIEATLSDYKRLKETEGLKDSEKGYQEKIDCEPDDGGLLHYTKTQVYPDSDSRRIREEVWYSGDKVVRSEKTEFKMSEDGILSQKMTTRVWDKEKKVWDEQEEGAFVSLPAQTKAPDAPPPARELSKTEKEETLNIVRRQALQSKFDDLHQFASTHNPYSEEVVSYGKELGFNPKETKAILDYESRKAEILEEKKGSKERPLHYTMTYPSDPGSTTTYQRLLDLDKNETLTETFQRQDKEGKILAKSATRYEFTERGDLMVTHSTDESGTNKLDKSLVIKFPKS